MGCKNPAKGVGPAPKIGLIWATFVRFSRLKASATMSRRAVLPNGMNFKTRKSMFASVVERFRECVTRREFQFVRHSPVQHEARSLVCGVGGMFQLVDIGELRVGPPGPEGRTGRQQVDVARARELHAAHEQVRSGGGQVAG